MSVVDPQNLARAAMCLAKLMTHRSLPEIGRHMGNRDHTTVMHGVDKITKQGAH